VYISRMWGAKTPGLIEPNFLEEDIRDVITCFKFGDDRFRGLASAEGLILPYPIDFDGRPYNTHTPCERVIGLRSMERCICPVAVLYFAILSLALKTVVCCHQG